jgi:hypothetical protein
MNKISELINKCRSNGTKSPVEPAEETSLGLRKMKTKLITRDSLDDERKQFNNIEKEFQKLSSNNATFMNAVSAAQEKFTD